MYIRKANIFKMEYQFQNTTNNIDALKLSKDKWLRLKRNSIFAKEVHENACKYADTICNIKKNSYDVLENVLEANLINNLRNLAIENINSNLNGMKVRDHSREIHSEKMQIFHKTLTSNDNLDTVKQITNGLSIQDPLISLPLVLKIIENKIIQGVVTGYYESIPQLTFAKVRISFNNTMGPRDTQFWHCDPGSYRVLKALIYLNDVDEYGGPFEIISGSHINKFDGWDKITRHKHEDLEKKYESKLFKKLTANAGDIIFADATSFHRGNVPIKKNRLILILNFCLHNEYGLPYENIKISKEYFKRTKGINKVILNQLDIV